MIIKFVIICMLIIQMPPQTLGCFFLYLRKTMCHFMSINSIPCHVVSYNAVTSSDTVLVVTARISVLQFCKVFGLSMYQSQILSIYVSISSEASLRFSQLKLFYRVKSASRPIPNPQLGGAGDPFTSE